MRLTILTLVLCAAAASPVAAQDGNRLAYLQENDPYYVHRKFPKLVTPQWIGEEGVEAVVILAIDDMKGHAAWETYLRPILERLKQIDDRAPVSIMTCQIDPKEAHLQKWLKEGVSLETHTFDHPCPFFRDGFDRAKQTYERAVDLLSDVPNNRPVAFRMPCCDSLNTPSPRFYAEIFNKKSPNGHFLSIDSSVFNVFTSQDPELPRELVLESTGQERFRKYLPRDGSFVNTIENYPYPYVIGGLCWEFPCATPSDWQAQNLQKPFNPLTVRDMKASLDCTVAKQGVFSLVFHPHGWIKNTQIIELIDHAVKKHGKKVKFLTFREALERLNRNLLSGQPLRHPKTGEDNGVRILDLDNDGYLDVMIAARDSQLTRLWSPVKRSWVANDSQPTVAADEVSFAVFRSDGKASLVNHALTEERYDVWHYSGAKWTPDAEMSDRMPWLDRRRGRAIFRDVDGDGVCELLVGGEAKILRWAPVEKDWVKLPFALPCPAKWLPHEDDGVRFIDLDGDGLDDVVVSNKDAYGVYLFKDAQSGWSRKVIAGAAQKPQSLPFVGYSGRNQGFWVHSGQLIWGNENTASKKDLVERRPIAELLKDVQPGPKSPRLSLKLLQPRPGFVAELTAAEPLVMDPIAFAWGADGKLWVVEMGDYPLGIDGKGKHGGIVRFLEDTDGDGIYDKSAVFLGGLGYPTGVLPWGKGVLVTCAPDIFYAEDTNGDGKADTREALYTGFREGNQQHRLNGLVRGLDNWLYVANGDSGGKIKSLKTGKTIDINGRDLRIKPETGDLEAVSGPTQFGRSRDDWGNWFGGNNINPMWHYVVADEMMRRNPHFAPPPPRVSVPTVPGIAPVYPLSPTLPRFNDFHTANRFTSANSPIVYRDDLFGPSFANSAFISEPVHNLVHREIMKADGVTFTSRRADDEQRSEFLASADSWFRPTMLQTGPDGALWIADMYRHVIEHPQWIPLEWQKKLDLRAGHDMGRLYRVYPADKKPRPIPNLAKLDTVGLVAALESSNGWQRDTAQYLLIAKGDKAAVPLLVKLADTSERPLARLHAMCTLDGLIPPGAIDSETILGAIARRLADPHPGVRKHAVRVWTSRFQKGDTLGPIVAKLIGDSDPQVRQQVAYALGAWDDPRAGQALGELAVKNLDDRYIVAAAMSSVSARNLDTVLVEAIKQHPRGGGASALVADLLRTANGLGHTSAISAALEAIATPEAGAYAPWQMAALASLLESFDNRNQTLGDLRKSDDPKMAASLRRLDGLFKEARRRALDGKAAVADRIDAVRILGRGIDEGESEALLVISLLAPQFPEELQRAAIANLGRQRGPRVSESLLGSWKGLSPNLRGAVLDVLLGRDEWTDATLNAIERRIVLAAEIDAARRQRLLDHRNAAVSARAAKLFAGGTNSDRAKLVDDFAPALKLAGDAARGQPLFAKICANCHRLGGAGKEVGPDLAGVWDKSAEWLLTSILDPNRAVEARYVNYVALLKNGSVVTGLLANESSNGITIVGADGQAKTVLRFDLDELTSAGKSAMPEGLEKDLRPQDIADVIAFIRSQAVTPKPKVMEGNAPATIRANADGSLFALASACEIRGSRMIFEKPHGNLGNWHGEDDTATWTLAVPRSGKYAVEIEFACDKDSAGNSFELSAGDERLTGRVVSTGGWDTYKHFRIGVIALAAGEQRIVFRSAGPIRGALIDLRSIKLTPTGK